MSRPDRPDLVAHALRGLHAILPPGISPDDVVAFPKSEVESRQDAWQLLCLEHPEAKGKDGRWRKIHTFQMWAWYRLPADRKDVM